MKSTLSEYNKYDPIEKSAPRVGVGIVVENNVGKLLLGKRLGSHGVGEWSFPGGHLEYGEEFIECAARELKEETGLEASIYEFAGVTNNLLGPGKKHYVTVFIAATKLQGEPQLLEPDKCEGWQWFDRDDLPMPLFATVASFIEANAGSTS